MSQIRYSPKSIQGVVELMAWCIILWAVNANWNSDNRYWNVNANSVENPNRWNAGNQVLSSYYLLSSAFTVEVLLIRPFFQPPTILPKFSISAPKEIYSLSEISFVSQRSWKKKRNESIWSVTSSKSTTFLLIGAYIDFLSSSKILKNS